VALGHAYDPVVQAAYEQMKLGNNYTRPAPVEVECAETLLSVIDGADQVKFAKDGSTVVSAGVKLARAYTGREYVAICKDHPFFSYNDWFIGTTEVSAGIPDANKSLTLTFHYDDIESLAKLFSDNPGKIACVVLEAARAEDPKEGFLHGVKDLCEKNGAVFLLDEMITGFRWDIGGAQKVYGIQPHLSAFGKAMANGFSLSALAGKREIMELGGLLHKKERVFLLSTTHGAENHALAAAVKTMQIYQQEPVIQKLHEQGEKLKSGIDLVVQQLGVSDYFQVFGRPCNLVYGTKDEEKKASQPFRTLFLQEIIKRGVLAPSFVISYSHSDDDLAHTVNAVGEALEVYKKALEEGVEKYLVGESVKPVYRRYN
jgi:glutamate-1-semialdehyde 2,1-aminomutase